MSSTSYTVEQIPASQLKVDPRVQRDGLQTKKIQEIEAKFNADALGVLHVSRRGSEEGEDDYIIDGWHRTEACKRKDAQYPLTAHVFRGLTVPEEALMFLDLNRTSQPTRLEKFKARLTAEDPDAIQINEITRSRGWSVSAVPANGNINAVATLERVHALSLAKEAEPHLLDATLLVISRAWGSDREGAQSVIIEGIARVLGEYGERVQIPVLIERLRERKGGPAGLHANARQMASMRNGRTVMAVAELVVDAYNKGARTRQIPAWGRKT